MSTAAGPWLPVMTDSEHPYQYDLIVIGSGPAGMRAAIQAAKAGRRVVRTRAASAHRLA